MKKCKITVLECNFNKKLADQYIPTPGFGPCHMMKPGDVFYTTGPFGTEMPENFCGMAWDSIGRLATVLASGGKVFGFADNNVACCNDGVRPVVFLLEPYEDDEPPLF